MSLPPAVVGLGLFVARFVGRLFGSFCGTVCWSFCSSPCCGVWALLGWCVCVDGGVGGACFGSRRADIWGPGRGVWTPGSGRVLGRGPPAGGGRCSVGCLLRGLVCFGVFGPPGGPPPWELIDFNSTGTHSSTSPILPPPNHPSPPTNPQLNGYSCAAAKLTPQRGGNNIYIAPHPCVEIN